MRSRLLRSPPHKRDRDADDDHGPASSFQFLAGTGAERRLDGRSTLATESSKRCSAMIARSNR